MGTPTSKTTSKFVTRVLDKTATPVYVISNDYTVTYANQACADWVGVELEQLIGAKCVYASQSQDDVLQDRIQGLCPPPSFFETAQTQTGDESKTHLVSALAQNQKAIWRTASISSLRDKIGETGPQQGVMVVCGDVCDRGEVDAIACAVDPKRLHDALTQIRTRTDRIYSLESLVGVSPYADRIRRQVDTAIRSDVDLLIHGPQGTGKEHLARTIHAARNQTEDSELLPVHCSIADQQLIQQNIKGFVSSRTDSQPNHQTDSNSRVAQDRLLLLDVDRLGEAAQIELLGFIRLPGFPLRTIATASECLIQMAEQGRYSQELAFSLSTMSIQLPTLAERQVDIPLLAQAMFCLLYTSPSPRDATLSRMPSSA